MGVSMNYQFSRSTALSPEEREHVRSLVDAANAADGSSAEPLDFMEAEWAEEPTMHGSSKLPMEGEEVQPWLLHILAALTAVRRALPGTEWDVDLEDSPVDWDEEAGFTLEGLEGVDPDAFQDW